jgi:hypothetical protein
MSPNPTPIDLQALWRVIPPDADPAETREWLEAFQTLVQH